MKMLRVTGLVVVLAMTAVSCNQAEEESETIDVQDKQEQTYDREERVDEADDEGNSIGIDVNADEEGNVEGELDGNLEFEDRK